MRQRINNTTVDGKKRIKLISRLNALSLSIKHKALRIAFEVELTFRSQHF